MLIRFILRNFFIVGICWSVFVCFLIVNLLENDFFVEKNYVGVESFIENKYFNYCVMFCWFFNFM